MMWPVRGPGENWGPPTTRGIRRRHRSASIADRSENHMNPVGARRAPGTRMPRLCALLLLCLANPLGLAAQTTTDRESVSKVIEGLFQLAGEQDGLARLPGSWSVVVAQFAKGDSRELRIPAKTGDHTESSVIPRPSAQTSTSASTTSKAPPSTAKRTRTTSRRAVHCKNRWNLPGRH